MPGRLAAAPDVDAVEHQLPAIFRAGTPNRPFFVRRLTAALIAVALEAGAISGTPRSVSASDVLRRAGLTDRLRTELEQNSLGRALLFIGAAVLIPRHGSKNRTRFQLTPEFAVLFRRAPGTVDSDAVAAYRAGVMRECGLDIGIEHPSYD